MVKDRIGNIINSGLGIYNGYPIPSWVDISVTELCTRTCPWCPKGTALAPNQPLDMPEALAKKISEELTDIGFSGGVNICGFGEPLTHPDICSIISALQPHHVELVTNGDMLDEKAVSDLGEAGLEFLCVSDYRNKKDEYTSVLSKASFKWDVRERPNGPEIITNRAGTVGKPYVRNPSQGCQYPFYSMQIDWNGDVCVCVQDWARRRKMGNISLQHIWNIWTGKPMTILRDELSCWHLGHPCKECDCNGLMRGKLHRKAWQECQA